jgi:hypothetical protein
MERKILENLDLIYGQVEMPKGFEIDQQVMVADIFLSEIYERSYPLSIPTDMLDTYIRDFIKVRYKKNLQLKKIFGNVYRPNEMSSPKLQINPFDLLNSPEYVLLYGAKINTKSCDVRISFTNIEYKYTEYAIPLETNKFVLFPARFSYWITKNTSQKDNFILTMNYNHKIIS